MQYVMQPDMTEPHTGFSIIFSCLTTLCYASYQRTAKVAAAFVFVFVHQQDFSQLLQTFFG